MNKTKFFLTALIIAVTAVPGFSKIPGTDPFIDDFSGNFVYYKDSSFTRTSYVGFLYYDDSTFALRYLAPGTKDQLPKDIALLFSVDSSKNYLDMTGEKILTPVLQEDTDILNYLHDLVYEFSARRKKAGIIAPQGSFLSYKKSEVFMESGFFSTEDYPQFGGQVTVVYDYTIPLFNLKKITAADGEDIFELTGMGYIQDSDAKEFFEYVPVELRNPPKEKKLSKIKPAEKISVSNDLWSLSLDKNFDTVSDNLWTMGDNAVMVAGPANSDINLILRSFLINPDIDFKTVIIRQDKKGRTNVQKLHVSNKARIHDQKILIQSERQKKAGFMTCLSISVYENFYKENKPYFDRIAESFNQK